MGLAASAGSGGRLCVAPGNAYQKVTPEYISRSQAWRWSVPGEASMSNTSRAVNGTASSARMRVLMLQPSDELLPAEPTRMFAR